MKHLFIVMILALSAHATAESGKDKYELTKGEWLQLQLQLTNPAQANLESHGCFISYQWEYPDTINVDMNHFKSYNKTACDVNTSVAKASTERLAKSYKWKWVKVRVRKVPM